MKPQEKHARKKAARRRPSAVRQPIGSEVGAPFRALFENAFDAVFVVDSEYKVLFYSPSVKGVLGYAPEELIGENSFELVHPDDVKKVSKTHQAVVKSGGRSPRVEFRLRHKNGSWRTVEGIAQNLLHHPSVKGVVVNFHDITERKQTEELLQRAEEKYRKAFGSSPDSITISHLRTGRFLDVNNGFERLTGYSRKEVIGKSVFEIKMWKDRGQRAELEKILSKGRPVRDFEGEFVIKGGAIRTALISAEIIELEGEPFMLGIVRDITDRKRMEEQLRRTSEQLRRDHEELAEKNIALKHILEHMEEDRTAHQHKISARVEKLFTPIIKKLKRSGGYLKQKDINALERELEHVIEEGFDPLESGLSKLTPRESHICELIKGGLTSKEIAADLGISLQTVHKHRNLIRRKLKLGNTDINLITYLRSR